ncbi:MAG TPA: GNAT family N-acetyltransferase [Candidatus Saccharimonadales bacterium]|nr:GNAT family N-acetyltransferase [Candidatus Saccharimonadales bacterium]
MLTLVDAENAHHFRDAADLFRAYASIPGIEVCLESFDAEIAGLPGEYAPPHGALLLAYDGDLAVGCVAIRKLDAATCEMKRLFVRPEGRGGRTGRRLAEAAMEHAAKLGYARMSLETLPERMKPALALYRSLGFVEASPTGADAPAGSLRLERRLP